MDRYAAVLGTVATGALCIALARAPVSAAGEYIVVPGPVVLALEQQIRDNHIDSRTAPERFHFANDGTRGDIPGTIALAIVRGIEQRKMTLKPKLARLEQIGEFVVWVYHPYDKEDAVVFTEAFPTARPAPTPGPLALDSCVPRAQYVVQPPSFTTTKVYVNYCGLR